MQLPLRLKNFQKKIQELENSNTKFRRIFSEYENTRGALWELQNSDNIFITDDFLDSIEVQRDFLESEIQDWLSQNSCDA